MKSSECSGNFWDKKHFLGNAAAVKSLNSLVTYWVTMYTIPEYALKAYALFYSKHGSREPFKQTELEWIVGQSMKKKIFSILVNSGWLVKVSREKYKCTSPNIVMVHLLDFKVPDAMKQAEKPYAFTSLSAIEIWSDYSYVQRGREKSPYFIKILKKDMSYWKKFFSDHSVPHYINKGTTIGEYVILMPVDSVQSTEKDGIKVEPLKEALRAAKSNKMFAYPYKYMRKKYGSLRSNFHAA